MSQAAAADRVGRVARELHGMAGRLERLPGERDLNYRLETLGGRYVLKLHASEADPDELDPQDVVLRHIAAQDGPPPDRVLRNVVHCRSRRTDKAA